MALKSRLIEAQVYHTRHRAGQAHAFRYAVFYAFMDLDEMPVLDKRFRLFSMEKGLFYSLGAKDFIDFGRGSIRSNLEQWLADKGLPGPYGKIQVLAHLRTLGYNFNPLSVFFVESASETLCIAEVHNTFGEAKRFLLNPLHEGRSLTRLPKDYYVSPFIEHDNDFVFDLTLSESNVQLKVDSMRETEKVLRAELQGRFQPFSDRLLLTYLLKSPLTPLKVMAGIHWQALKIYFKGIPHFKKSDGMDQQKDFYAVKAVSKNRG